MSDSYSVPSNWLANSCLSESDETLILAPSCLNSDFRCKIFIYQCQIHMQQLQID